jgi:hypothetical protein
MVIFIIQKEFLRIKTTMKTIITQREARELEGIRVLSKKLEEQLQWLTICVAEIIDEDLDEDNYGHSSDFIYSNESSRSFLKKRGIAISKTKTLKE